MAYENSAGLGNYNHYGPRVVNKENAGAMKTEGSRYELSIDLDADFINDAVSNGTSRALSISKLPAGCLIAEVVLEVSSAFTLTGTTPTVEVGTEGGEAANGASLSEAQLEAVGVYDVSGTLAGTWAASLAAETQIGFALGGTSPTIAGGSARLVIRYDDLK